MSACVCVRQILQQFAEHVCVVVVKTLWPKGINEVCLRICHLWHMTYFTSSPRFPSSRRTPCPPCGLVVDNNSGDNKDKPSNLAQNAIESFLATDNLTTTTTTTSSRLEQLFYRPARPALWPGVSYLLLSWNQLVNLIDSTTVYQSRLPFCGLSVILFVPEVRRGLRAMKFRFIFWKNKK